MVGFHLSCKVSIIFLVAPTDPRVALECKNIQKGLNFMEQHEQHSGNSRMRSNATEDPSFFTFSTMHQTKRKVAPLFRIFFHEINHPTMGVPPMTMDTSICTLLGSSRGGFSTLPSNGYHRSTSWQFDSQRPLTNFKERFLLYPCAYSKMQEINIDRKERYTTGTSGTS